MAARPALPRISVIPIRIQALSGMRRHSKTISAARKPKCPVTKMAFASVTNPQEIEDLWAYLKQFDINGEVKK
jgi:hypothetical protein